METAISDKTYSSYDEEFRCVDGLPLLASIYQPKGSGPHPAIVEVHGGAWTAGDRLRNARMAEYLASQGIFVLSIDFRMPPVAAYPASLVDINFAIRWLKSRASELNIVAEKIGGLGTSSGGHQIMLSAMRPNDLRYSAAPLGADGSLDARLAFVIACWPILDPLGRYKMAIKEGKTRLIEGHHAFWADEAEMSEGSPQEILDRGEPATLAPALIVQGTADDNLDHLTINRFADSYRNAGGTIEFRKYEGAAHAFIEHKFDGEHARDALNVIRDFIFAQSA